MTDEQRAILRDKVDEWRRRAAPVGPMHALWDAIFDAEALLAGKPTVLRGTEDEIYAMLIKL